jgi:hypothetical protein
MGKHYVDPVDKPTLIERHYCSDHYTSHTNLYDMCLACVLVPTSTAEVSGPEEAEDGVRRLYAVEIPYNTVRDVDEHCRFYFSWHGAMTFLRKHNMVRVNKQNQGNKRKARLLVYTLEEMREYLAHINSVNTLFTVKVGL